MKRIQKRNGDIVAFDIKKIEVAINKAANAVSFKDFNGGKQLSEKVESILDETSITISHRCKLMSKFV